MPPHTIVALANDHHAAMPRTVAALRHRGFRILDVAMGPSEVYGIGRMTFTVSPSEAGELVQALERMPDVVVVRDVTAATFEQYPTITYRAQADGAGDEEVAA